MKKSLRKLAFIVIVATLTLSSCVDNAYDLSDIDTDNQVIGTGGFVVPLGNVEIDLTEFIEDYTPMASSKAVQTYEFRPYTDEYDIEAGFDDGLIDQLTEYGEITLHAAISNVDVFKFNLDITVDFINGSDKINLVTDRNVSTAGGSVALESKLLNKEILTRIANSTKVGLSIAPTDGQPKTFQYDVNQAHKVSIRLTIKKTGGIKL